METSMMQDEVETELILVKRGEVVNVFQGRCPHQGSLLAEGRVKDGGAPFSWTAQA